MSNPPPPPQRPQAASDPPQSIPLRSLHHYPDDSNSDTRGYGGIQPGGGDSNANVFGASRQYNAQGGTRTSSNQQSHLSANMPGPIQTYWEPAYRPHEDAPSVSPSSPLDHTALQYALPPDIPQHPIGIPQIVAPMDDPYQTPAPDYDSRADTESLEDDRAPLRIAAQPIARLEAPEGDAQRRDSMQTVSDMDASPVRSRSTQMLGFDLENGFGSNRHRSYGDNLGPGDRRSRSPSTTGALSRAGSMMRAMSQRVVMISGEGDLIDQQARRERSRSPSTDGIHPGHISAPMMTDTSYPSQVYPTTPAEKGPTQFVYPDEPPPFLSRPRGLLANPLKGNSLGIFSPENPVRKSLCDLLVNPWTEPLILILIVLQAVLLAVEAAPDALAPGNERPERWGSTRIDWAIFGLFVVFTLELIAKIIVSGLIVNADEYVETKRKGGVRARVAESYRTIFRPQRQKSVKRQETFVPTTFARSFTMMHGQHMPETMEDQQRLQLARRAFLRHGFNRLDFVAVISFWISFVLGITGLESRYHVHVFRMLSCLRIIRLLALTKGNLVGLPPSPF